ncbi:GNAT family N-acetyltransferase [Bacillus sp. T3]|uniref:GNAT family N-acetyltransferase n=1 Tax=Bacillus sp. T3 TaxID=467262 RepID=UPI00298252AF|nr:GNAT family N-acetyltransferase [Bacillus sp. T3]
MVCEKEGGFLLKLNFDMLENRSGDRQEDFFHYEDGVLVGFLGSYGFGNKVELCGMVHPDYRRKGIFSSLLKLGIEEAKKWNIETILLNAPSKSHTAKAFLSTIPCTFSIAEYQMQWHQKDLSEDDGIKIRPSFSKEDSEAEIQLDIAGFGMGSKSQGKSSNSLTRIAVTKD